MELMRAKCGLIETKEDDASLIQDLLALMHLHHVDYTIFFRALGLFQAGAASLNEPVRDLFLDREAFDKWARRYKDRLREEGSRDDDRMARMNRVNPKYVLRNYLAQTAIEKAQQKDFSEIERLLALLEIPTVINLEWTPMPLRLPIGASIYRSVAHPNRMLNKSASGVLALLRGSTYRSVRRRLFARCGLAERSF